MAPQQASIAPLLANGVPQSQFPPLITILGGLKYNFFLGHILGCLISSFLVFPSGKQLVKQVKCTFTTSYNHVLFWKILLSQWALLVHTDNSEKMLFLSFYFLQVHKISYHIGIPKVQKVSFNHLVLMVVLIIQCYHKEMTVLLLLPIYFLPSSQNANLCYLIMGCVNFL